MEEKCSSEHNVKCLFLMDDVVNGRMLYAMRQSLARTATSHEAKLVWQSSLNELF